jgi:hypothetical protein
MAARRIIKLIELRWRLPPLGTHDASADGLSAGFDFH